MTDVLIRQKLSQCLPGWESAAIERISEGQSPNCYLLTHDGQRALMKLDTGPRDAFVNARPGEAHIQQQAAEIKLAPRVLCADTDCIVTEYWAADIVSVDALTEDAMLRRLGELLKNVHALPVCGLQSDIATAAKHYGSVIQDVAMADRCIDAVASVAGEPNTVLCHNDVVVGNILDDGRLALIDWEYARDHSPLFDLATVIAHHALDMTATKVLLDAYDGSGVDSDRLAAFLRAYHGLHWLWLASRDPQHSRLASIAEKV